jgi:hypothetical protein
LHIHVGINRDVNPTIIHDATLGNGGNGTCFI